MIKLAFDEKLVGRRIGFAYFVVGVNAGGNLAVIRVVRLVQNRNGERSVHKGGKKIRGACVGLLGKQYLRMKNDIFILHALICGLFNRVQLPRNNKGERSGAYGILLEVDGNNAFSFFYIDNFHFVVPVDRNIGKVQRNGAGVSNIRKQRIAM